jgi:sRNA-binding protein
MATLSLKKTTAETQQKPKKEKPENKENKENKEELTKKHKKHKKYKKKKKQESVKKVHKTLEWLCSRFPKCFNLEDRQPLEIGIKQKIVTIAAREENSPTQNQIQKALKRYTISLQYFDALICKTHRIDLEGNLSQEITNPEKDNALNNKDRILASIEKRKKKEEERATAKAKKEVTEAVKEEAPGEILEEHPLKSLDCET